MAQNYGLLRVVSNTEIRQQELAAAAVRQAQPMITGLAAYVSKCWETAKLAKMPIENQMLTNIRQRNGEYDPTTLNAIKKQGGSEIYMMITEVKCRAAESWLRDILLDEGTPPWDIRHSPIPDLPQSVAERITADVTNKVLGMIQSTGRAPSGQELQALEGYIESEYRREMNEIATQKSEGMKAKIEDQFVDGGWSEGINQFISDLVTYPAAFLKGPIVRKQKQLDWVQDPNTGTMSPNVVEKLVPVWERVDPYRIFPEPGITVFDDGYLIEQHRLTRGDLIALLGVPGYDDGAVKSILDGGGGKPDQQTINLEMQKSVEEKKNYIWLRPSDVFEAIQFWGVVDGKMLRDWGMTEDDIPDPDVQYPIEAWAIGGTIIKAILNYDPLGKKPYYKTSFIKIPGAFWGRGIPEVIADIQQMCNAAARSLSNNMGISSGPQVVVNIERLPAGEDVTQVYPWKLWQVTNDPLGNSQSAPPISFEQPASNADVLMQVYDKFSKMADDHSGIPAYIYGDTDVSGAGRTASGLSMLMGSAGKGIRQVIMYMDSDVIKPAVERQYIFNMRYDPDNSIKGDCEIVPMGVSTLATKEQLNVRRVEFLTATANEFDMQIIGLKGRAAVLREVAKGLELPEAKIVPSDEELTYREQAQAAMAQQQNAAAQGQPDQYNMHYGQNGQLAGVSVHPGGQPKGGQDGNVVANKKTGKA